MKLDARTARKVYKAEVTTVAVRRTYLPAVPQEVLEGRIVEWSPREYEDDKGYVPGLVRLADVAPEKVGYLWRPWLPLGKLVIFDGDPGTGKSVLSLSFAATATTGGQWPDGTRCPTPISVLLLSAEDGFADTIRPPLDAAGADVNRILAIQMRKKDGTDERLLVIPGDLHVVEAVINQAHIRLVIVDVLMTYLDAAINSNNDQEIRKALASLAAMAQRSGTTVLVLRHLNKGSGGRTSALYRGGGSIGITGQARVVFAAAADPKEDDEDDFERMALVPVKFNLAKKPPALGYHLVEDIDNECAVVEWLGRSSKTAEELIGKDNDSGAATERNAAERWLRDYLTQNGRTPSAKCKSDGLLAEHKERTIERAAKILGVLHHSVGGGKIPRSTDWELPAEKDDGE